MGELAQSLGLGMYEKVCLTELAKEMENPHITDIPYKW